MKIVLKCELCGKKLELNLHKGIVPTGSITTSAASTFGFTETSTGYICSSCDTDAKKKSKSDAV